jgi:hypothetical protein
MANASPFVAMDIATATLDKFLLTSTGEQSRGCRNLAQRWLFPEPEDLDRIPPLRISPADQTSWVDQGLNEEQRVCYIFIAVLILVKFCPGGSYVDIPVSDTDTLPN